MISWFNDVDLFQKKNVRLLNLPRGPRVGDQNLNFVMEPILAEMSYRWSSLGCRMRNSDEMTIGKGWPTLFSDFKVILCPKTYRPARGKPDLGATDKCKNKNEHLFYLFICCLYLHGLKRCLLFFLVLLQLASEWLFDSFVTLVTDPDVWLVWLI